MTVSAIIALVRDIAILIALGFIIWWIRSEGENTVKLADLQAVQKQLDTQSKEVSQWHQEALDAQNQHTQDLAQVTAAIGAQRQPVRLCNAPRPDPVPAHPAAATSDTAGTGGIISSARDDSRDVRPDLNAFELRIEKTVADCRLLQQSWPRTP